MDLVRLCTADSTGQSLRCDAVLCRGHDGEIYPTPESLSACPTEKLHQLVFVVVLCVYCVYTDTMPSETSSRNNVIEKCRVQSVLLFF